MHISRERQEIPPTNFCPWATRKLAKHEKLTLYGKIPCFGLDQQRLQLAVFIYNDNMRATKNLIDYIDREEIGDGNAQTDG